MKCSFSEQPYQWQDGDAWHVGNLVLFNASGLPEAIDWEEGIVLIGDLTSRHCVLVRHVHTNTVEFVQWGKLSPYPSSPIPEPTNTGKAVEGE